MIAFLTVVASSTINDKRPWKITRAYTATRTSRDRRRRPDWNTTQALDPCGRRTTISRHLNWSTRAAIKTSVVVISIRVPYAAGPRLFVTKNAFLTIVPAGYTAWTVSAQAMFPRRHLEHDRVVIYGIVAQECIFGFGVTVVRKNACATGPIEIGYHSQKLFYHKRLVDDRNAIGIYTCVLYVRARASVCVCILYINGKQRGVKTVHFTRGRH